MGMTFYPGLTLAEMVKIVTICSLKLIWIESSILRCLTRKMTGQRRQERLLAVNTSTSPWNPSSRNWSYVTFHDKRETWSGLSSVSNESKPESLSGESRAVRDMVKDVTVTWDHDPKIEPLIKTDKGKMVDSPPEHPMLVSFASCAKYLKEMWRVYFGSWFQRPQSMVFWFHPSGHIKTARAYGGQGTRASSFPKYTNNEVPYLLSFWHLH